MTRKLFSIVCVVIPALGLTFSPEEAQARHRRCCRVQQCCWNGGYQVGWQQAGWQQAGYQQQPIQQDQMAPQPMQQQTVYQAGYQGTCCVPQATCCGFQGGFQGQGQLQPQAGYDGQTPAAPAPPQEGQAPPREGQAPPREGQAPPREGAAPPPAERDTTPPPAPRNN